MSHIENPNEHLMSPKTFNEFTKKMWEELEKHREEKPGIKNTEPSHVWELCVGELEKRISIIKTCGPDDISKQALHIANYMYFLHSKMQEFKK